MTRDVGARLERTHRTLTVTRVAQRSDRVGAAIVIGSLLLASALLARVHRFEWTALTGFCVAVVLGLSMLWKLTRTPGEL